MRCWTAGNSNGTRSNRPNLTIGRGAHPPAAVLGILQWPARWNPECSISVSIPCWHWTCVTDSTINRRRRRWPLMGDITGDGLVANSKMPTSAHTPHRKWTFRDYHRRHRRPPRRGSDYCCVAGLPTAACPRLREILARTLTIGSPTARPGAVQMADPAVQPSTRITASPVTSIWPGCATQSTRVARRHRGYCVPPTLSATTEPPSRPQCDPRPGWTHNTT